MKLTGSIVALVTPFKQDGRINYEKLGELIEFHIENQTDGILILGTTGESPTISYEEQKEIVRRAVIHAKGRIHIMVGSGCNDTAKAIKMSQEFEQLGVDSLLVITPYYNKTNESGMVKHFEAVANVVNIPIILYNVPDRTGCLISTSAIETLSKHPKIAGIKEASGDISYAMTLVPYLSDDFVMYSGNDDIIVPLLSIGAIGVISVWANVMPQAAHDVVSSYLNKNPHKSLEIQLQNLDFINALFVEINPIPVKYMMNELGFDVGILRAPLGKLSFEHRETLHTLMDSHLQNKLLTML